MVFHPYRFTDEMREFYWSPHYHFINCGFINPKLVKAVHEKTGLIFTTHRTFTNKSEVIRVLAYLFSHTGVKKIGKRNMDAIRYWGQCQNSKFKTERVLTNCTDVYQNVNEIVHDLVMIDEKNQLQQFRQGLDSYTEQTQQTKKTTKFVKAQFQTCKIQPDADEDVNIRELSWGKVRTATEADLRHVLTATAPKKLEIPHYIELTRQSKDNPAKSEKCQNDEQYPEPLELSTVYGYVLVKAIYERTTVKGANSEKCQIEKRHVFYIDPGTRNICGICGRKYQRIIPELNVDVSTLLEYIDEVNGTIRVDDIQSWMYYDYYIHGQKGLPYWKDGIQHIEDGVLVHNEHADKQPDTAYMLQDIMIMDSKIEAKTKELIANSSGGRYRPSRAELKEKAREIVVNKAQEEIAKQQETL